MSKLTTKERIEKVIRRKFEEITGMAEWEITEIGGEYWELGEQWVQVNTEWNTFNFKINNAFRITEWWEEGVHEYSIALK